jgi:mRNA interferase MazF
MAETEVAVTLGTSASGEECAKISQIRTLATERIGNRLGRASPEELAQVLEGLNDILGA